MEPVLKCPKMDTIDSNHKVQACNSTPHKRREFIETGVSCFDIISKGKWYADKTLFIKAIFKSANQLLITAPRRFCKSTNMDMLKTFVEIELDRKGKRVNLQRDTETGYLLQQQTSANFNLFTNKNIFTIEENGKGGMFNKEFFTEHFGRYPTICVDFRVLGMSYKIVLDSLRCAIEYSFHRHRYLVDTNLFQINEEDQKRLNKYFDGLFDKSLTEEELIDALPYLSQMLCAYHKEDKKVFVFIDEFDAPLSKILHYSSIPQTDIQKIIKLIRTIISKLLNDNPYVERALFTGSQHISDVLSRDAINLIHLPAFESKDFCHFYGFTGEELKNWQEIGQLSAGEVEAIEGQYKGYTSIDENNRCVDIYSSWSILHYLSDGKLSNHWADCGLFMFKRILSHNLVAAKIIQLLNGHTISIKHIAKLDVEHVETLQTLFETKPPNINSDNADLCLQFLFGSGYFNLESKDGAEYTLRLPSLEIQQELCRVLFSVNFFSSCYNLNEAAIKQYVDALLCVLRDSREGSFLKLAESVRDLYRHSTIGVPDKEFVLEATLGYLASSGSRDIRHCKLTNGVVIVKTYPEIIGIVFWVTLSDNGDSVSAIREMCNTKCYTSFKETCGEEEEETVKEIIIGLHIDAHKKVTISYLINDSNVSNVTTVSASL